MGEGDRSQKRSPCVALSGASRRRVVEVVPRRSETFAPDVDPSGSAIERGVWLVLAAPGSVEAIERKGFSVRELRRLEHLDRVLIRVEAPVGREPAEAQLGLVVEAPDIRIDHNHLYRGVGVGNGRRIALVRHPESEPSR